MWVGLGECDLFLPGVGECDLLGPFFGWLLVGLGECDFFLAECWWMLVGETFFWLVVGGCGWSHTLVKPFLFYILVLKLPIG